MKYIYIYIYILTHIYIYIYIYIYVCVYFLICFDPESLPYKFLVFLLRRWTGDPPETLSGLTSNPLSLMW